MNRSSGCCILEDGTSDGNGKTTVPIRVAIRFECIRIAVRIVIVNARMVGMIGIRTNISREERTRRMMRRVAEMGTITATMKLPTTAWMNGHWPKSCSVYFR